jgi:DnaJ-class molecular chaperone
MVEETKEFVVHIERGMEDGDKIVFQGAAHEIQDADTGDLVVVVREEPHSLFQRKHQNLLIKKSLSLSDALFGTKFVIEHLDARKLVIGTRERVVIAPGTVEVIPGEGMPSRGDPYSRGDLFVEYSVEFPEYTAFTEAFKAAMWAVVPQRDEAAALDFTADDVVSVSAESGDIDDFNNAKREKRAPRNEAYREDDGDEGEEAEGSGVSCAPM